ncbi:MAG: hypothetical protein ACJ75I_03980 [Solirubrobacterales bacterium]
MSRIRAHLTYANVIATIALFLVLSGGTAVALTGSNTVFSDDIVDDQVVSADVRNDTLTGGGLLATDLRAGSVRSSEVANDSLTDSDLGSDSVGSSEVSTLTGTDITDGTLTGDDVDESSLAQVPNAALGGIARSGTGSCNPGEDLFTCKFVSITLPSPSRVLMIGSANAHTDGDDAHGTCLLATDVADLPETAMPTIVTNGSLVNGAGEALTMSGVTPPMVGAHDFAIRCRQDQGDMRYGPVQITAVALSPN